MHRLIIFAEPTIRFAPSLLNSFLKELKGRNEIDWVKVCVTSEDTSRLPLALRSLLTFTAKTLINPRMARSFDSPRLTTVTAVARKHGVEVIEPPHFNINDPAFIRELEASYAPTLALSLGCLQIWSADLLGIFPLAVNFHNGYLPDYKGLWTTHWSVYRGEEYSGYAFHVMDENIDTGPILFRGRVPIPLGTSPAAIARLKMKAARKDVGKVLDAMISGRFEYFAQPQRGSYFSRKASMEMWTIDDPKELTAEEFFRRVRCFAPLKVQIEGVRYPVTSLRPAGTKGRPLSFVTADDVELYPDRLQFIPTRLYLAAHGLKVLKVTELLGRNMRRHSTPRG